MAEFRELIEAYNRMCDFYFGESRDECEGCPLQNQCDSPSDCRDNIIYYPELVEEVVTKWSLCHHHVEYPTWDEWLKQNFHGTTNPDFKPCMFDSGLLHRCNDGMNCEDCRSRRIDSNIAVKLGIKPRLAQRIIRASDMEGKA